MFSSVFVHKWKRSVPILMVSYISEIDISSENSVWAKSNTLQVTDDKRTPFFDIPSGKKWFLPLLECQLSWHL
jgi:hypothetical protein